MRRGFQVVVSGVALAVVALAAAPVAEAQDAPAQPAAPVLTLDKGEVALITILIKQDKTADFEMVLNKLKEALSKSEKAERKQQAAGWKIFKAVEPGPADKETGKPTVVYVMRIDPVIKGQEYDISRLIAEVFPVEVQELFGKYKDAFYGRIISFLTPVVSMQ